MITTSSNKHTTLVPTAETIEVKVKANPDNEMAEYAAVAIYDQLDQVSPKPLNITQDEIKEALISFVVLKTNPKIDIEAFRLPFLIPSFLYNILSKLENANSTKVMYSVVKLTKEDGYNRDAMDKFQRTMLSFGKSLPIAVESGFPKNKERDGDVISQLLTFRKVTVNSDTQEQEHRPLDGEPHPENWRQATYLDLEHVGNPILPEMSYGNLATAKGYFHEVIQ